MRPLAASVPIPKFASLCGTLVCELRNRRTLATYDLVWLWFRSPHFGLAARLMRTSEPPHWCRRDYTPNPPTGTSQRRMPRLRFRDHGGTMPPLGVGPVEAFQRRAGGGRSFSTALRKHSLDFPIGLWTARRKGGIIPPLHE